MRVSLALSLQAIALVPLVLTTRSEALRLPTNVKNFFGCFGGSCTGPAAQDSISRHDYSPHHDHAEGRPVAHAPLHDSFSSVGTNYESVQSSVGADSFHTPLNSPRSSLSGSPTNSLSDSPLHERLQQFHGLDAFRRESIKAGKRPISSDEPAIYHQPFHADVIPKPIQGRKPLQTLTTIYEPQTPLKSAFRQRPTSPQQPKRVRWEDGWERVKKQEEPIQLHHGGEGLKTSAVEQHGEHAAKAEHHEVPDRFDHLLQTLKPLKILPQRFDDTATLPPRSSLDASSSRPSHSGSEKSRPSQRSKAPHSNMLFYHLSESHRKSYEWLNAEKRLPIIPPPASPHQAHGSPSSTPPKAPLTPPPSARSPLLSMSRRQRISELSHSRSSETF